MIRATTAAAVVLYLSPAAFAAPAQSSWQARWDEIDGLLELGHDDQARPLADANLAWARKNGSRLQVARSLEQISRIHRNADNREESERLLLEAVGLIENDHALEDLAALHVSLGRLYLEMNRLTDSDRELGLATDLHKKLGPASLGEKAILLGAVGDLRQFQGRIAEAEDAYGQSLVLFARLGVPHTDRFLTMAALARMYADGGHFDASLRTLDEHVKIMEGAVGLSDSRLAILLNDIGMTYLLSGRPDLAERAVRRAYDITNGPGAGTRSYVGDQNLGAFYLSMNRLDESLCYFHKAWESALQQKVDPATLAPIADGLAQIVYMVGQNSGTRIELESARFYAWVSLASEVRTIRSSGLMTLGATYAVDGKWIDTEGVAYRLVAELSSSPDSNPQLVVHALDNYAVTLEKLGKKDEAAAVRARIRQP